VGIGQPHPIGSLPSPGTISLGAPINANDPSGALGFYPGRSDETAPTALPFRAARDAISMASMAVSARWRRSADPTLNWATFNVGAQSGPNWHAQRLSTRIQITYYSAAVQYTGGAITVDQRLTMERLVLRRRLLRHAPVAVLEQRRGQPDHTSAFRPGNPYYPTGGAPTTLRVSYHALDRIAFYHQCVCERHALYGRLETSTCRQLGSANLLFADKRLRVQSRRSHGQQRTPFLAALGWTHRGDVRKRTQSCHRDLDQARVGSVFEPVLRCAVFRCNAGTTLKYIGNFRHHAGIVLASTKKVSRRRSFVLAARWRREDGRWRSNYTSKPTSLIQQFVQNTSNPTLFV
jgi:hypothetical protein